MKVRFLTDRPDVLRFEAEAEEDLDTLGKLYFRTLSAAQKILHNRLPNDWRGGAFQADHGFLLVGLEWNTRGQSALGREVTESERLSAQASSQLAGGFRELIRLSLRELQVDQVGTVAPHAQEQHPGVFEEFNLAEAASRERVSEQERRVDEVQRHGQSSLEGK